jgi:hypothetical protein
MPRTLASRGIVLCSCTPRTEPRVFSSPAVCSALSRRESILVCTFPLFRDKSASTGKFVVHSLVRLKAPKSHFTSQERPSCRYSTPVHHQSVLGPDFKNTDIPIEMNVLDHILSSMQLPQFLWFRGKNIRTFAQVNFLVKLIHVFSIPRRYNYNQ